MGIAMVQEHLHPDVGVIKNRLTGDDRVVTVEAIRAAGEGSFDTMIEILADKLDHFMPDEIIRLIRAFASGEKDRGVFCVVGFPNDMMNPQRRYLVLPENVRQYSEIYAKGNNDGYKTDIYAEVNWPDDFTPEAQLRLVDFVDYNYKISDRKAYPKQEEAVATA